MFGGLASSNDSQAIRAAETQGFTSPVVLDTHVGFVSWQGCGKGCTVRTN